MSVMSEDQSPADAISGSPAKPTPCPICKEPAAADGPAYPFCSKRCRTIDLGKWISGDYVVSRPIEEADLDQED